MWDIFPPNPHRYRRAHETSPHTLLPLTCFQDPEPPYPPLDEIVAGSLYQKLEGTWGGSDESWYSRMLLPPLGLLLEQSPGSETRLLSSCLRNLPHEVSECRFRD
jgi:hypothetical protein